MKVNIEAVSSGEYCVRMVDLPCTVKAMVCYDGEGFPNIYVNARLSREEQEKAIHHEICHICRDDVYSTASIQSVEAEN